MNDFFDPSNETCISLFSLPLTKGARQVLLMMIFTFDTSCGFCGFLMSGNLRFYGVGYGSRG